jgi:WD40 repeat protein
MLENRSYHRDILVVGGGDFLVSTRGQFDGFKLRVWSLKDDYESTGCLEGHSNFIRSMIPTSQGQIVTVSDDRSLRVWHFRQAYPLRQYFHNYKIHHVLLNEEQDMLVIIDENNKVTVLSF